MPNRKMPFPKPELNTEPTAGQLKHLQPTNESLMLSFQPDAGEIDISHLELAVTDTRGRVVGSLTFKGDVAIPLSAFEWRHVTERDEQGDLWKEARR